jgi:hypothetical protein
MTPGETVQPVHDQAIFTHVIFSQLEGRFNGANSEFRWEGQGWSGTDYNKLWIKSEGTLQGNGTLDDGQQQFLYSRAITTYFDLQGGLRSDLDSRPTRNWGAFGIQGLAPYFFDAVLDDPEQLGWAIEATRLWQDRAAGDKVRARCRPWERPERRGTRRNAPRNARHRSG